MSQLHTQIYELVNIYPREDYTDEHQTYIKWTDECLKYIKAATPEEKIDFAMYGIKLYGVKETPEFNISKYIGEAIQLAADKENAKALYLLGLFQEYGTYPNLSVYGRNASAKFAADYMTQSAEKGFVPAQSWMGSYHAKITKDVLEACKWHSLAANNGDLESQKALLALKPQVASAKEEFAAKESFTVDKAREEAAQYKDKTLVLKGFYLGMDIQKAAWLLTEYMKARPRKDVSKELDSASDSNDPAQMMAAMESMSMALVDGLTGANPQKYEVTAASNGEKVVKDGNRAILTAGNDGKVKEFFLPPKILSVLFGVDFKAVSSDKFLETFRSAYGLGSFKSDTEKVVVMTSEEGFNELKRYESDKGFSVLFYDESSHVIGDKKAMELKVMGMGNVYDKNTMIIRATASKAKLESSFD